MNSIKQIIINEINRHPALEINDVIKLLYQASFGCGHIIKEKNKAKEYLLEEFSKVIPDEKQLLTEEVGNGFIRVNLARYKLEGLDIGDLFDAFYLSSKEKTKGMEDFINNVELFREMIEEGELPFSINEFDLYFNKYVDKGMPLVSHSKIYHDTYDPHYRVVHKQYWFIKEEQR